MSYGATVILVLIASPSDVVEERKSIVDALNQWNSMYSIDKKVVLLPVMWETHSSPEMGEHPQHVINRQIVKQCDIAIACFWTRLGTKTPTSDSGTIEEIEIMLNEDKLVMIYFSETEPPDGHDKEQLTAVKNFRKSINLNGLIDIFTTSQELKDKVLRQISSHVSKIVENSKPSMTTTHTIEDGKQITNITMHDKKLTAEEKENIVLINVLKFVFREAKEIGVNINYCCRSLKMDHNEFKYYLDILLDKNLIATHINDESLFMLSKKGRAFVLNNSVF